MVTSSPQLWMIKETLPKWLPRHSTPSSLARIKGAPAGEAARKRRSRKIPSCSRGFRVLGLQRRTTGHVTDPRLIYMGEGTDVRWLYTKRSALRQASLVDGDCQALPALSWGGQSARGCVLLWEKAGDRVSCYLPNPLRIPRLRT